MCQDNVYLSSSFLFCLTSSFTQLLNQVNELGTVVQRRSPLYYVATYRAIQQTKGGLALPALVLSRIR